MKIGLIGYQGSGKSTLFEWLTGVPADPAQAHTGQTAMAPVPEPRVDELAKIYHPKKLTYAALEIVDTPGLNRSHEGNAQRLGLLRDTGALVMVVAAFGGASPQADLARFQEDLLLADMEIVAGRIDRLRDSVKKPRPNREQEMAEIDTLAGVLAAMEAGKPLAESAMSDEQLKATRSFRLLTEKPALVILNLADDEPDPAARARAIGGDRPALAIRVGLARELTRLSPEDRAEFERDMGIDPAERNRVLRTILDVSGQMLYFTAGEKEVRTWMLRKGGTALEAADNVHSDLARGFIRAEVMTCRDLLRLGSEREVKAHNLVRQEPKDYIVADDDILNIKFSV
ncbi:MAG: redox-regulated ATPase YchF [Planctomycetia bacterium]|nr:redox-regulated ATPase YchF [Planctomycetia bacterium]